MLLEGFGFGLGRLVFRQLAGVTRLFDCFNHLLFGGLVARRLVGDDARQSLSKDNFHRCDAFDRFDGLGNHGRTTHWTRHIGDLQLYQTLVFGGLFCLFRCR